MTNAASRLEDAALRVVSQQDVSQQDVEQQDVSQQAVSQQAVSRRAVLALPLLLASALGACSSNKNDDVSGPGAQAGNGGPDELFAETASFETVAGVPQRVMVGLTTRDGRVLHGGTVRFTFAPVTDDASAPTSPFSSDASFLSVPRSTAPPPKATIGSAGDGIGIYEALDVTFPTSGFWTVTVEVALDPPQQIETAVEVVAKAQVPAPGEDAPKTENPTQASSEMPIEAIDSRSGPAGLDELADPLLHRESVASVLAEGRPCVVIVSTPAFCVSKFCGPLTDIVNDLADEARKAGSDVGFVHLEVWRSFEKAEVNRFAADWILTRGAEGREPWIFLIDRTGKIAERWDNLVAEGELRSAIASL